MLPLHTYYAILGISHDCNFMIASFAVLRLAWSGLSDTKQTEETQLGRRRRNRVMPPVR